MNGLRPIDVSPPDLYTYRGVRGVSGISAKCTDRISLYWLFPMMFSTIILNRQMIPGVKLEMVNDEAPVVTRSTFEKAPFLQSSISKVYTGTVVLYPFSL